MKHFAILTLLIFFTACADSSKDHSISASSSVKWSQGVVVLTASKRKPRPDPEPGICRDRSDFGMCSDGSLCCKLSPSCADGSACR